MFEDWDWDENMMIELAVSINVNQGEKVDANRHSNTADGEMTESSSDEDEDGQGFKCSTCGKVYYVKGWLVRHQTSWTGEKAKKSTKTRNPEMSESQKRARKVFTNLGFKEFFVGECMPLVRSFLVNLASTPSNIVEIRGHRFATCQQNAKQFCEELENGTELRTKPLFTFVEYAAQHLWTITFARDYLSRSSKREQYIAQHLHAFFVFL